MLLYSSLLFAEPLQNIKISPKERCPICGMFVTQYDEWITLIHDQKKNHTYYFDGVKDMMVFYFSPGSYGGGPKEDISDMQVKDYYSLDWVNAQKAYYVIGSDVYGPMGHEFIPFSSHKAAQSFLKDHHGKRVIMFPEITIELVESMRSGQRMR